jgi:anti-sigma regulatory factor (Ser/Thr protein kinase)
MIKEDATDVQPSALAGGHEVTTTQCRSATGVVAPGRPASILEQSYAGQIEAARRVRPLLRAFLNHCSVADALVTVVWELAANACLYSDSALPGGHFSVRVHDFPGDHVYADVQDEGSDWDADLATAASCPHGLFLLQQLGATYGTAGGRRGRIIWFTIDYPVS